MFKSTNIENLGSNINGEKLRHLPFVGNLVLTTDYYKHKKEVVDELDLVFREIELNTNIGSGGSLISAEEHVHSLRNTYFKEKRKHLRMALIDFD